MRGCGSGLCHVFGRFLPGFWQVSGRFLAGFWQLQKGKRKGGYLILIILIICTDTCEK